MALGTKLVNADRPLCPPAMVTLRHGVLRNILRGSWGWRNTRQARNHRYLLQVINLLGSAI